MRAYIRRKGRTKVRPSERIAQYTIGFVGAILCIALSEAIGYMNMVQPKSWHLVFMQLAAAVLVCAFIWAMVRWCCGYPKDEQWS